MIRIVKLSFKEEHVTDFKHVFESRKLQIKNFEGCLHLELWQDQTATTIFYTYSIWTDKNALEKYRMSSLFNDTWSTIKPWFDEKPFAFSADKFSEI